MDKIGIDWKQFVKGAAYGLAVALFLYYSPFLFKWVFSGNPEPKMVGFKMK